MMSNVLQRANTNKSTQIPANAAYSCKAQNDKNIVLQQKLAYRDDEQHVVMMIRYWEQHVVAMVIASQSNVVVKVSLLTSGELV